jgi:hypothetical protein
LEVGAVGVCKTPLRAALPGERWLLDDARREVSGLEGGLVGVCKTPLPAALPGERLFLEDAVGWDAAAPGRSCLFARKPVDRSETGSLQQKVRAVTSRKHADTCPECRESLIIRQTGMSHFCPMKDGTDVCRLGREWWRTLGAQCREAACGGVPSKK